MSKMRTCCRNLFKDRKETSIIVREHSKKVVDVITEVGTQVET